jgi:hypothetical protein
MHLPPDADAPPLSIEDRLFVLRYSATYLTNIFLYAFPLSSGPADAMAQAYNRVRRLGYHQVSMYFCRRSTASAPDFYVDESSQQEACDDWEDVTTHLFVLAFRKRGVCYKLTEFGELYVIWAPEFYDDDELHLLPARMESLDSRERIVEAVREMHGIMRGLFTLCCNTRFCRGCRGEVVD